MFLFSFITFYSIGLGSFYSSKFGLLGTSSNNNYRYMPSFSNEDFSLNSRLNENISYINKLIIPNQSNLIIDFDNNYRDIIISKIVDFGGIVNNIYKFHNQMAVFIPSNN